MKLLIDTHSFLWFVDGDPNLSADALAHIQEASNEIFLSVASIWEIAIKISIGKLKLTQPLEIFLDEQLGLTKIGARSITVKHAANVANMPRHHSDPFDRLIIAQAITEQMPIISKDAAFDAYGVTRLW